LRSLSETFTIKWRRKFASNFQEEKIMGIVAVVLLAGLGGMIFTYISPLIQAKLPASLPQGKIAQGFIVGFIILLAIWGASLVLSLVGLKKSMA
jgi:hypothetical protein